MTAPSLLLPRGAFRRGAAFLLATLTLAGCAGSCDRKDGGRDDVPFTECDAGDVAFIRNASLAILGRRTLGQAEVNDYLAMLRGNGRDAVIEAMMDSPGFADRWSDHFLDALKVPRVDDQSMFECYANRQRATPGAALAEHVRDHDASDAGDGNGVFTMGDLLESSLLADDLSPLYRAHLFAMVAFPIPAANVPRVEAELARRDDFGGTFDAAYLNRDLVCLSCHNSEYAVTWHQDPAQSRHWPLAGLPEKALYAASAGIAPARAHAVFRFDGFADAFTGGTDRPWGWAGTCGQFERVPLEDDPAGVEAHFGAISGQRATVYELEASLRRGVDGLAATGLEAAPDGTIPDPDRAFAYLVGASIAEGVWKEIVGSGLTIANYFPRNEPSRDVLQRITNRFVEDHFSLRTLVREIVLSEYFNQHAPEEGCGTAYGMPNVYDPWVIGDDDPERRRNGPADGVSALSARVLLRSSYTALEWPFPSGWNFPATGDQYAFYRGIGLFLKNGEHGFRGLDFQARLVWEERFAACAKPTGDPDFVDDLVADAAVANATIGDVALALKDRLVNQPVIAEGAERAAIEEIFGATLESEAASAADLAGSTRRYCGVLLASPQFLLGNLSDPEVYEVPRLNP